MASSTDYVYAGESFTATVTGSSNITSGGESAVTSALNAVGVVVSSFAISQPSLLKQIEDLDFLSEPYQVDLQFSAGFDYTTIADMRFQISKAFQSIIGTTPTVAILTADGDPVDAAPVPIATSSSITTGASAALASLETKIEALGGATKQTADFLIWGVVILGVGLLATFAFSSDKKVASIVPRL